MKNKVYASILEVAMAITPQWNSIVAANGVTAAQAELLFLLGEDDVNISKISGNMHVTSSAATQLVESLETKGLVKRKNSKTDRRVVYVTPTDKGEEVLQKLLYERRDMVGRLLNDLSDDEMSELIRLHKKMIKSIGGKNGK